MDTSDASSGQTPEFSAISTTTNKPVDLPSKVVWDGIQLEDDEMILYVTEEGEQQIVTTRPFDDEAYYKVILFDYSTGTVTSS